MISIAICEDNIITAKEISQKIDQYCPDSHHIDIFTSAKELLTAVEQNRIILDILFMDIELGDDSGIQVSKKVNMFQPDCQIIYITNYMDYFKDVYETSHIYFILKKEMDRYIPMALEKVLHNLEEIQQKSLIIHSGKKSIRILQSKITYMERLLRTTEIHTKTDIYKTSENLVSLQARLCSWFVFSHRSYLVNSRHIVNLEHNSIILSDGSSIPVSRSHYKDVQGAFTQSVLNK